MVSGRQRSQTSKGLSAERDASLDPFLFFFKKKVVKDIIYVNDGQTFQKKKKVITHTIQG